MNCVSELCHVMKLKDSQKDYFFYTMHNQALEFATRHGATYQIGWLGAIN